MEIETIPSIQLSLSDLHSLLYGFDEFFGDRSRSLSVHERPIFPILIIPYSLGVAFRNHDSLEKYFHVEFIPPHKAEIWNSKAWHDSLTRRLRLAGAVQSFAQTPQEAQRSELEGKLLHYFSKICHLRFAHARAMTEFLISGPDSPDILQLAGLPMDLAHLLQNYRESNESHTDRPEGS